ncbi:hypothetical protein [Catenulispora subtropica]|uniref:Uncharacterized protein n=1 Tax=Catenulispora subtropica TaxID=450798 RepID=A0ABN2QVC0_9ACTN
MIIEEHEDGAVRGLLGTAFGAAEPPLRDLASGSIARGDAARRRNRWYATGGAVLSVVAAVGTFAAVAGSGGVAGKPAPAAATTAKPTPTKPKPSASDKQQPHGALVDATVKSQDIRTRLPGLLQPMLPAGVTIQLAPSDYTPLSQDDFLLTGPSGTTVMTASGGRLEWSPGEDRKLGCLQKGSCDVHKVAGGTVYVNADNYTASDQMGDTKGALKPGSEKMIVGQDVWMTFVPDDRNAQYLQIREATTVAAMPYADKAPAGWTGTWPPSLVGFGTKNGADPHGVQLSADDFAALARHAGIDEVETLLDPRTTPSADAVKAQDDRNAKIEGLLAQVLPAGVKATLTRTVVGSDLILTGPSGQRNLLRIATLQRNLSPFSGSMGCGAMAVCQRRTVPGGQVLMWGQVPTDSKLHPLSDKPNSFDYWYLPDDTSQPAVQFSLTTNYMSQTVEDVQLTTDQFAAAAANPHLSDIADQVVALLKQ